MSAQAISTPIGVAHFDPDREAGNRAKWRYLIIGAGPVGMRTAQEILARDPQAQVRVLGQEAVLPYDRIKLTSLLAGDVKRSAIDLALPSAEKHPGFDLRIARAASIFREEKRVLDAHGESFKYDKLILATGSSAHVPEVPGDRKSVV